jgi:hypothetical protein
MFDSLSPGVVPQWFLDEKPAWEDFFKRTYGLESIESESVRFGQQLDGASYGVAAFHAINHCSENKPLPTKAANPLLARLSMAREMLIIRTVSTILQCANMD